MGWFTFKRSEGYPTHYPDQHSPANTDILIVGLIIAFLILGISLLSLLPSYNGKRKWIFFGHVVISLVIGGILMLANFGSSWEVGKVRITSPYKAGSPGEVKVDLGIHIGLRGINITLNNADLQYHNSKDYFQHEEINYNEYFSWEGSQGRFGFGYYAAKIARDFREAVYRGLPIPILQLAEYFTFDGEGIRFGRHYRLAGYYTHILMWTAFPCWIIASILFCIVVRYGALFLMATGILQFLAICVWYFTRNFIELHVPFESGHDEVILVTHFGTDFYMVLFNSIFCLLFGFIIFWINAVCPDEMCQFFGIDPLTIYDEYHMTNEEIVKAEKDKTLQRRKGLNANEPENGLSELSADEEEESGGIVRRRSDDHGRLVLKRRTDAASRLFQRSFKVKPGILPRLKPSRTPGRLIREENEMTARTPLLANLGNNASDYYVNDIGLSTPRESLPNFPPPPPVVPPRIKKMSDA